MGTMWTAEPGPAELEIYDLLFEIVNSVVEDRPLQVPENAETPKDEVSPSGSDAIEAIQKEGGSP